MYDISYTIDIEDRIYCFEWDGNKEKTNIEKHGLSFMEAVHIWLDVNRIEYFDEKHSQYENRWLSVGAAGDILLVVYTLRKDTIRIISARIANRKERKIYYG